MIKIAIVVSEFNKKITNKLLVGAVSELRNHDISEENITIVPVPGAVEIPLTAKLLGKRNLYDAIICLGAVIRGDTDHYIYVCEQVSFGIQKIMLELEVPIIFGILTTNTEAEADERVGGKEGHKGIDAAKAALRMIEVVDEIKLVD